MCAAKWTSTLAMRWSNFHVGGLAPAAWRHNPPCEQWPAGWRAVELTVCRRHSATSSDVWVDRLWVDSSLACPFWRRRQRKLQSDQRRDLRTARHLRCIPIVQIQQTTSRWWHTVNKRSSYGDLISLEYRTLAPAGFFPGVGKFHDVLCRGKLSSSRPSFSRRP